MSDVFSDAEARYDDACARRAAILELWEEQGKPVLTSGSTGQLVEHPLMKQLNDLDKLCDRLGATLSKRHAGPSPAAVVNASVGQSPAAKLRSPSGGGKAKPKSPAKLRLAK